MELRHLHYFIAVAEELHLSSSGAVAIFSPTPAQSADLHFKENLEKLFERTKRQVHLTEAGKSVFGAALTWC